MINSFLYEVQLGISNALCPVEYTAEDVLNRPRMVNGKWLTLDETWHTEHMRDLADFVIDLLENTADVPQYLAANKSQFTPTNLLGN